MLPLRRRSAYLGGGGETVEVVALGSKPVAEVAGVALLFQPIADDQAAGAEPTFETVGGAVQAGLVTDDLLVQTADQRRNVRFPPLLGVDLPLRLECGFLPGVVPVPPAGADLGRLLGLSAGVAGPAEIPDRLTRLSALPHTAAGVEFDPGFLGLR